MAAPEQAIFLTQEWNRIHEKKLALGEIEHVDKEGWMVKSGGPKNWKKRWFVLDGVFLYYFEDNRRASIRCKGVFLLAGGTVRAIGREENKENCFMLSMAVPRRPTKTGEEFDKARDVIISCNTPQECNEWVDALRRAMQPVCVE